MLESTQIVILAAGKGTRMQSDLAKVLHPLLGKPMLYYVIEAVMPLKPKRLAIVTGHQADKVEQASRQLFPQASTSGLLQFALQAEQLGTGHAVWCARQKIDPGVATTLIINGDGPLITTATLQRLLQPVMSKQHAVAVMTFKPDNVFGYGRIVRNNKNLLERIVEERDASDEEKKISEACAGIYAANTQKLLTYLDKIMQHKLHKEYYITDIVKFASEAGETVAPVLAIDAHEGLGINTLAQLAEAETFLNKR